MYISSLSLFPSLQAYSDGVNDNIDSMSLYPVEFYILQAPHPEPWTPEDSVSMQFLMQYLLSFDWLLELTRHRLTEIYDKDLVDRMLPLESM